MVQKCGQELKGGNVEAFFTLRFENGSQQTAHTKTLRTVACTCVKTGLWATCAHSRRPRDCLQSPAKNTGPEARTPLRRNSPTKSSKGTIPDTPPSVRRATSSAHPAPRPTDTESCSPRSGRLPCSRRRIAATGTGPSFLAAAPAARAPRQYRFRTTTVATSTASLPPAVHPSPAVSSRPAKRSGRRSRRGTRRRVRRRL